MRPLKPTVRPFLLAQLSDLHICAPGVLAYGNIDTAAYLRTAIATLASLPCPPDVLLLTGDLSDGGQPAQYAHLRQMLAPVAHLPMYCIPGNHDRRSELRRAFAAETGAGNDPAVRRDPSPYIQYTVNLGGMRLIALDSTVSGSDHGCLCPSRLAWLSHTLARYRHEPVIIALHHPPLATHIRHMDEVGLLEGREAFCALVAQYPNIQRIISGHIHRAAHADLGHVTVSIAPSPAHQIAWNPIPSHRGAWTAEPPSFYLHSFYPGESVISHLIACGDYPPHAFEAAA